MESYEQGREQQREAAAERIAERAPQRGEHEAALAGPGGIAAADTPERIAKRLDRLSRYCGADAPAAEGAALLEKIINTDDFVGIRYLDAGVGRRAGDRPREHPRRRAAACRATAPARSSRPRCCSPTTTCCPTPRRRASSAIEFNYQDGIDGRPLRAELLDLDPDRFFLADDERDFALVAVARHARRAGPVRLQPADRGGGQGDHRRVRHDHAAPARREEADRAAREPDRRHPRAVPALLGRHRARLVRLAGVQRPVGGRRAAPRERAGAAARRVRRVPQRGRADQPDPPVPQGAAAPARAARARRPGLRARPRGVRPARGAGGCGRRARRAAGRARCAPAAAARSRSRCRSRSPCASAVAARTPAPAQAEAISIDPDYTNRGGYDPEFLGACRSRCRALGPDARRAVASAELRYHHFSVVMHRKRGARALHGGQHRRQASQAPAARERPLDPRPAAARRRADRRGRLPRQPARPRPPRPPPRPGLGHRRGREGGERRHVPLHQLHPAAPRVQRRQHALGRARGLRARTTPTTADLAVSVFTGPVLADDDDAYRGVQLPRQFWKVVAMVKQDGALSVTGYLLSQAALLDEPRGRRGVLLRRLPDLPGAGPADRGAHRPRPRTRTSRPTRSSASRRRRCRAS